MAARSLQMDGAGRGAHGSRRVLQHCSRTAICVCVPAPSRPPTPSRVSAEVGGSEWWRLGSLRAFKSGEEKVFWFEN